MGTEQYDIVLPQTWQEWKLVEELGEGSFGAVYKAVKRNGDVEAVSAIKVIRIPAGGENQKMMLRRNFGTTDAVQTYLKDLVDHCADEIRFMYTVQGESNIVNIQDHYVEENQQDGTWKIYIRMEYLKSLSDYIVYRQLGRMDIIRLGIALCNALSKCEMKGILHRDIKPDNIFVTDTGEFKLGDFGIARYFESTYGNYSMKGTCSYMAPEVYRGEPYGKTADLYSVGMVLYKYLNKNCEPFIQVDAQMHYYRDFEEALKRRMNGEAFPVPVNGDEGLVAVVLKACAFRPEERYQNASELKQDLELLLRNPVGYNPVLHQENVERRKQLAASQDLGTPQRLSSGKPIHDGYNFDATNPMGDAPDSGNGKKAKKKGKGLLIGLVLLLILGGVAYYVYSRNMKIGESQPVEKIQEPEETPEPVIEEKEEPEETPEPVVEEKEETPQETPEPIVEKKEESEGQKQGDANRGDTSNITMTMAAMDLINQLKNAADSNKNVDDSFEDPGNPEKINFIAEFKKEHVDQRGTNHLEIDAEKDGIYRFRYDILDPKDNITDSIWFYVVVPDKQAKICLDEAHHSIVDQAFPIN